MRWLPIVVMFAACTREPVRDQPRTPTPSPQVAPAPPAKTAPASDELFAIGGVGFAGETSPGEARTLEQAKRPDAIAVFEAELASPDRARRLYAYWALRTLDPERAAAHREALASDQTVVHAMSGCIGFDETTAKLVATAESQPMPKP